MKLRLRLLSLKNLFSLFRTNFTWGFWLLLIVLLAAEGWVLKDAVIGAIRSAQVEKVEIRQPSAVRVNFADYQNISKRMEQAKSFYPSVRVTADPFQVAP